MMPGNKMAVLCRYGGKFIEETGKISYEDGTNRLIYVDPEIHYPSFQSKLSEVCMLTAIHSMKYQYPTLGLDTLVSIESDEDILYMNDAFSSQSNRPIQVFISGTQKTLPKHNGMPEVIQFQQISRIERPDSKAKVEDMMSGKKITVVCRYSGNFIVEDGKVYYKDATNRLICVHPQINYATLLSKLCQVCKLIAIKSIKYQHPTLGLDVLVSIENDEDIFNMKNAFFSQPNPLIQFFVSGAQNALSTYSAIPRNEGSLLLHSAPSDPFQFVVPQVILSPLLDLIFRNLSSIAREGIQMVWGVDMDIELQNLKSKLSAIRAVLECAEEKQLTSKAVQNWLQELQDIGCDVDDMVDEIVTEVHEIVTKAQPSKIKSRNAAINKRKRDSRMSEMNAQLAMIATKGRDLRLETRDENRQLDIRRERRGSVRSLRDDPSRVFGYEGDREHVTKSLLSDNSTTGNFSVVAIVGTGGVGKTTLAQVVYNDKMIAENFELRAWLRVSKHFDVERLTKEIIESACKSTYHLSGIDNLQRCLRDELNGKKFLLVLDDVWSENNSDWEQLQAPFLVGGKGSRILITSRSPVVPNAMQATCTHSLQGLSEQDSWNLYASQAFEGKSINSFPDLLKIGKELVNKCGGLPLAAKALGVLLSSKMEIREWKNILKSPIWDLRGPAREILPTLRLSYLHLPAHLKRCFTFCSLFPKDRVFRKDKLVQLWVAHGFVCPEEGKEVEDTGSEYFNDFLLRSFFQPLHKEEEEQWIEDLMFNYWFCIPSMDMLFPKWTSCKIHDLFYDLAQFSSDNECFQMEHDQLQGNLRKIRHLYIGKPIKVKSIHELKSLRTFCSCKITNVEIVGIFQRWRFIRVLDLSGSKIRNLPSTIGSLRHLRYLDLSDSKIERLPESICSIYNLQTLLLRGCYNLVELPNEIRELSNLRHLDIGRCQRITSMAPQIGGLTCLRTLPMFIVGRDKERSISELKALINIRGKLLIKTLENVAEAEHARQANLWNKPLIDELSLVWGVGRPPSERLEEEVANELRPHHNLKALGLWYYLGAEFPRWMIKMDMLLPNLKALYLINCRSCSSLPPLGGLPSLALLIIDGMNEVKQIDRGLSGGTGGLPSLKYLILRNMKILQNWQETEENALPRLQRIQIWACPQLRQLPPNCLANLTRLYIENCASLISLPRLSFLKGLCPPILPAIKELSVSYCDSFDDLPLCPSLCKLHLGGLNSRKLLTSVPFLTSLSSLTIHWTSNLTSLSRGMLQALIQLKNLKISYCEQLVTLVEENGLQGEEGLPATLTHLSVYNCYNLRSLPRKMHALTSLQTLIIVSCPRLTSLPENGLPTALQNLEIRGWRCEGRVLKERCRKEVGEDWHKVSHIPHLIIEDL